MLALGLGANGVCPYTMVEVVCVEDYRTDIGNLCAALAKGMEKVISTIGIHEVRGYARQFSSIGVRPELAEIFQTEAFAASERGGAGFAALDASSNERARILCGDEDAKPAKTFRFYPKVYKPNTRRRCATWRCRTRSRCATSWASRATGSRSPTRRSSTPASATTTTRW
jgi:glutamate synthase (NADPH/NADH) large chain